MKKVTVTLRPETSLLLEALQLILKAEDKVFDSASLIYGDELNNKSQDGETPISGGEYHFEHTGLKSQFEELKKSIKLEMGDTLEQDMLNILGRPDKDEFGLLEDRIKREDTSYCGGIDPDSLRSE